MTDKNKQPQGTVLMVALLVMLAVAVMTAQGMRLMVVVNRSHHQRVQRFQMDELLELSRLRLAQFQQVESFTVEVPQATSSVPGLSSQSSLRTLTARVTIEKQASEDAWRIQVQYPYQQPGETTATWETPNEKR